MKLIEAQNEDRLIEKKLDAMIPFLRQYAARPSVREAAYEGKEAEMVSQKLQACMDLIQRREWLRRAITYTNLVSATEVNGKLYSLQALIQHKNKKGMFTGGGEGGVGICFLKKKVLSALDDRPAHQEVDRIRALQPKEAAISVTVIRNFDQKKRDDELNSIMELEMAIDSALQIANTKLDLLDPPADFLQKA